MPIRLTPRSSAAAMAWPAVPDGLAAQLLALQQQLAQSEQWSPERLARHQFRQLRPLLLHAYDQSPFYRARLDAGGYRRGQEITPEFWARLPLLQKRDLQEQGAAALCREVPREHGGTISGSTSGSTGAPLRTATTEHAQLIWQAITLRQQYWHGRDLNLKFASIRRDRANSAFPPSGTSYPDWLVPEGVVYPTGPACLLDNRCTPA